MTPQELYEQLKELQNEDSIKELAVSFDTWIRGKCSTLESMRTAMTDYNKLIKSIPLVVNKNAFVTQNSKGEQIQRHLFYKYAGLKPEEYELLNRKEAEKKAERLDNRTQLDVDSYLQKIGELLTSDDPHALAVGLIGATGRRPHEILVRAEFKVVKESDLHYPESQNKDYWVMFSGQGKKRGKAVPYPIATLYPAKSIIQALRKLRNSDSCKQLILDIEAKFPNDVVAQNDAIDNQRNTSLNRIVQSCLAGFLEVRHNRENISCSSLRAAYARLATERDCPKGSNDLMWAGKLLGHFSDSKDIGNLLTTLGYFDYYVDNQSVPFLEVPKAERNRAYHAYVSDIEAIEEWRKSYGIPTQPEAFRKLWELAQEGMKAREEKLGKSQPEKVEKNLEENLGDEMISKNELAALIEEIIERKFQEREGQLLQKSKVIPLSRSQSTPAVNSQQPTATATAATEQKDWESVPSEELRGSKAPGSAEEKIRRIIKAIMEYNDYTATSNGDRWYIGIRTIQDAAKDESGSGSIRYDAIKKFLEQYGQIVDDHNAKYGLTNQHNKRHQRGVASVISW